MSEQLSTLIKSVLTEKSSVSFDHQVISSYLKSTEGFDNFKHKKRQLMGVICLTHQSEIKSILTLANECATDTQLAFSLYPISTGKNWGYGTSLPASTDKNIILLDLGRLNNICHYDNELGLVTVEPGVTQQQLSNFLVQHNYPYMVPVTGAGPECSILANAIERGYGITPYTDHFSAVTSVEGFWANGTPFQSAIAELDHSEEKSVDKTFKWGIGPYLDGLFTQSNLGIVSQVTLRLANIKPDFISFFIQLPGDNLLEDAVPLIREILQNYEGIVGSINLMDQRRILSMFANNPNENDRHKVMSDLEVKRLSKVIDAPSWTIVGSIYGSTAIVKAVQKDINALFKQIPCRKMYSNSLLIKVANKVFNHCPQWLINLAPKLSVLSAQLTSFYKGKEIMLGTPNKVALNLAYWRHKNRHEFQELELSPEQDGCGLLWYAPLITMKKDKVREFVTFIREICPKYNIEPFITFTLLKHDCVDSTIPIVFDLTNKQAVTDAHNCLEFLMREGQKKGFIPYRLNVDQQIRILDKESHFWRTVNILKDSLDPKNILSIGRYNPR